MDYEAQHFINKLLTAAKLLTTSNDFKSTEWLYFPFYYFIFLFFR